MKARVYVSFKETVLDPQGKTICSALRNLGFDTIVDVRQGKFFEITFAPDADREKARRQVENAAQDVLANPVIETFRVEFPE